MALRGSEYSLATIEQNAIKAFNSIFDAPSEYQQSRLAVPARAFAQQILSEGTNEQKSALLAGLVKATERRDPHYQVYYHGSIDFALISMLGNNANEINASSVAEGVAGMWREHAERVRRGMHKNNTYDFGS